MKLLLPFLTVALGFVSTGFLLSAVLSLLRSAEAAVFGTGALAAAATVSSGGGAPLLVLEQSMKVQLIACEPVFPLEKLRSPLMPCVWMLVTTKLSPLACKG